MTTSPDPSMTRCETCGHAKRSHRGRGSRCVATTRCYCNGFVPAPAPSTDLASEQMVELERAVSAAETLIERLKIVEPAMQAAFAALGDESCTHRERVSRATSILSRAMLKVSR